MGGKESCADHPSIFLPSFKLMIQLVLLSYQRKLTKEASEICKAPQYVLKKHCSTQMNLLAPFPLLLEFQASSNAITISSQDPVPADTLLAATGINGISKKKTDQNRHFLLHPAHLSFHSSKPSPHFSPCVPPNSTNSLFYLHHC